MKKISSFAQKKYFSPKPSFSKNVDKWTVQIQDIEWTSKIVTKIETLNFQLLPNGVIKDSGF